jgi:2-oxoglutarate dehydrogenase E1 component
MSAQLPSAPLSPSSQSSAPRSSHAGSPALFQQWGPNAGYIAELYALYQADPSLVGGEWANYFAQLSDERGADTSPKQNGYMNGSAAVGVKVAAPAAVPPVVATTGAAALLAVQGLQEAFRRSGHFAARVNPLSAGVLTPRAVPELSADAFGVQPDERIGAGTVANSFLAPAPETVADCVAGLTRAYCGTIGFEVHHLPDKQEREWWYWIIESEFREVGAEDRRRALRLMTRAEGLESEIHRRYVGVKRFSVEGGEAVIPMIDRALASVATRGTREAVIGMAHRGRVNVLANILHKPLVDIFREFEDKTWYAAAGAGDVKYHHGYRTTYSVPHGDPLTVTLAPNPSHLEFVNPVVEGMAKGLQVTKHNTTPGSVLPIVLHGDAAIIGQGVVAEAYNLARLCGYDVGGTLHIVINNQVGFTATPLESRSSDYCTDTGKAFNLPVLHVNGDDVDACLWAAELAARWRAETGRGILIDLICYRKYGHNEGDDPTFTQPMMYQEIRNRPSPYQRYRDLLVGEGVVSEEDAGAMRSEFIEEFNHNRGLAAATIIGEASPLHGKRRTRLPIPAIADDEIVEIARSLTRFPADFEPHPKVKTLLEKRVQAVEKGVGIDWGLAEGLLFGLLAREGKRVRLSGQDAGRGTFSQRHLVIFDSQGRAPFIPLSDIAPATEAKKGAVEIITSALSESAIIGYEFGYAHVAQNDLTLWEGQFGDFVNGAQVYIDQFLSSSESKWGQLSGLVLLLPHAYEGQGSEHSSARLERFLQIAAEGNITVAYPSTAAQHFHLLRRHAYTEPQRPLIVMTGKSLLRLPDAAATRQELTGGSFQSVLVDSVGEGPSAGRVVFCSGKIYHDLVARARAEGALPKTLIVRLEELYPFPVEQLREVLTNFPDCKSALWVQEEHENMGAWRYVEPLFRRLLGVNLEYVGREEAASTADGSGSFHARQQARIVAAALKL